MAATCSAETYKYKTVSMHMFHIAQEICGMAISELSHMKPVILQ